MGARPTKAGGQQLEPNRHRRWLRACPLGAVGAGAITLDDRSNISTIYPPLAGQRDGVFRDRSRRTITITNTALTAANIGRANAVDEVRENILWRRIHHEQRNLLATAWTRPVQISYITRNAPKSPETLASALHCVSLFGENAMIV
eukprot:SAG11_NODE_1259_length_5357_cov_34.538227_7_plen_146_part_00